jgi:hypothetical protein
MMSRRVKLQHDGDEITLSHNMGVWSHVELLTQSYKSGVTRRLRFVDPFVTVLLLANRVDPDLSTFAGGWKIRFFASMIRRSGEHQFGVLESLRWNDCQGSFESFAILSFGLDIRITQCFIFQVSYVAYLGVVIDSRFFALGFQSICIVDRLVQSQYDGIASSLGISLEISVSIWKDFSLILTALPVRKGSLVCVVVVYKPFSVYVDVCRPFEVLFAECCRV